MTFINKIGQKFWLIFIVTVATTIATVASVTGHGVYAIAIGMSFMAWGIFSVVLKKMNRVKNVASRKTKVKRFYLWLAIIGLSTGITITVMNANGINTFVWFGVNIAMLLGIITLLTSLTAREGFNTFAVQKEDARYAYLTPTKAGWVLAVILCTLYAVGSLIFGYDLFHFQPESEAFLQLKGMKEVHAIFGSFGIYAVIAFSLYAKGKILPWYNDSKNEGKAFKAQGDDHHGGDTFMLQTEPLTNASVALAGFWLAVDLYVPNMFWIVTISLAVYGLFIGIGAYKRLDEMLIYKGELVSKKEILKPLLKVFLGKFGFLVVDAYVIFSLGWFALILGQTFIQGLPYIKAERDAILSGDWKGLKDRWLFFIIDYKKHKDLLMYSLLWNSGEWLMQVAKIFVGVAYTNVVQSLGKHINITNNEWIAGKLEKSTEVKQSAGAIGLTIAGTIAKAT